MDVNKLKKKKINKNNEERVINYYQKIIITNKTVINCVLII